MSDLIISLLSSIGGSVLLLGLFGWLGKRHLDKILGDEKRENQKELEKYKKIISKDIEDHKLKLRFNEVFFNNQFQASLDLYEILKTFVPKRTDPESDWHDALSIMTFDLKRLEDDLIEFLKKYYTTLPPDIVEELQKAEYLCPDAYLMIDGPEFPNELLKITENIYYKIRKSSIKLKSLIDGQRNVSPINIEKKLEKK